MNRFRLQWTFWITLRSWRGWLRNLGLYVPYLIAFKNSTLTLLNFVIRFAPSTPQVSRFAPTRSNFWKQMVRYVPRATACWYSHWRVYVDLRQFQKTLWRPFKLQFPDIERGLQEQSENIDRELAIASENAACKERQVASLYRHQGYQNRALQLKYWEESREWRVQQDIRQKGK